MHDDITSEVRERRKTDYDIHPIILNRWSPRSMTGAALTDDELMSLFEAARWAPSSYNAQPWRFLYAKRDTAHWGTFLDLLVEGNRLWAQHAAVLVLVVSRKTFERNGKPSVTSQFDAGAAWENLALEGTHRGLVVHGMEGFDYARAREVLRIPNDFDVLAMIAIGRRGRSEDLPEQLRTAEAPNGRRPLHEIVIDGPWPG